MGLLRRIKRTARKLPLASPLEWQIERLKCLRCRVSNVAMMHSARCGSSVLGDLLDQHDDMHWAGEIFDAPDSKSRQVIARENGARRHIAHSKFSKGTRFYGFETKFLPNQQLRSTNIDLALEEYLSLLRDLGFSKFIVLQRKNLLRQTISALIGRETQKWRCKEEAARPHSVEIDVNSLLGENSESLLSRFRGIDTGYEVLRELLHEDDVLELSYEEDVLENPITGYRRICNFIGMPTMRPAIKLKKQNPFGLREMVTNFEEVAGVLEGTEYEWMLDD